MSCPTCDHTMQCVAREGPLVIYWCPRCGTLSYIGSFDVPKLVERCVEFVKTDLPKAALMDWHRLGIDEASALPAERTALKRSKL